MVETIGTLLLRASSLEKKNPKRALAMYEKILEIEPEIIVALEGKADCLWSLGRYEEQLDCLDKIIEYGDVYYDLYHKQIHKIEKEEKISLNSFYDCILDGDISIGSIYGLKTGTLFQLDRYEEALDCNLQYMIYRNVDSLLFDHLEIQSEISDVEYIKKLKAILEFFPKHYPTLRRIARTCYKLEDYQNSLKYHTRILEIYPDMIESQEAVDLIKEKIKSKVK